MLLQLGQQQERSGAGEFTSSSFLIGDQTWGNFGPRAMQLHVTLQPDSQCTTSTQPPPHLVVIDSAPATMGERLMRRVKGTLAALMGGAMMAPWGADAPCLATLPTEQVPRCYCPT